MFITRRQVSYTDDKNFHEYLTLNTGPFGRVEPYRKTKLVASSYKRETETHLFRNSVKLQNELEELVTVIQYNQKQRGSVPPELDKQYHQVKEQRDLSMRAELEEAGKSYLWKIGGQEYKGKVVEVWFNSTDNHSIELTEVDASGGWFGFGSTRVLEGKVACGYVRREINEMITEDRSKFFAAVTTMYKTPTKTGRTNYGKGETPHN